MKRVGRLPAIHLAIILGLILISGAVPAARAGVEIKGPVECSREALQALGLTDQEFHKPVTITSAEMVAAGKAGPEHCECRGRIWPQINFVVKIPNMYWNSRFLMVGGAGWNGEIREAAMTPFLRAGYATAATDSGHQKDDESLAVFAYNPPDNSNPHAAQKKKDHAYRSYHETVMAARSLIQAFQGDGPKYSYWVGCSEGGREALLMAQRYPRDFSGIICGAPLLNLTGTYQWFIWNAQALDGDGGISTSWMTRGDQIPYLAEAVYNRCDGLDGLVDGLIDDPRQCDFNPARDLKVCDQPSDTCFSPAQIQALKRVYGGVRTAGGRRLIPGIPLGAEREWKPWILGKPSLHELFGESFMLYYACSPPLADLKNAQGEPWTWRDFNFDRDPRLLEETARLADMTDTNLKEFKAAGGKLIQYHGWSDTALNALMSIDYYEGVRKTMGPKATDQFYRLYLIPGAAHCGGGVGCFRGHDVTTVLFPALVWWVERDVPPGFMKGIRPEDKRTRPLCPYPQVARFLGSGGKAGIETAENFVCVKPAAAQVRIQAPVSVGKDAVFTARLTLPAGQDAQGLKPVALVCAGAPGGKVQKVPTPVQTGRGTQGRDKPRACYQAEFKGADLINIQPGEAVPFTLTGIFDKGGQRVAFEGVQRVRVLP